VPAGSVGWEVIGVILGCKSIQNRRVVREGRRNWFARRTVVWYSTLPAVAITVIRFGLGTSSGRPEGTYSLSVRQTELIPENLKILRSSVVFV
jgi:hypothetical protein